MRLGRASGPPGDSGAPRKRTAFTPPAALLYVGLWALVVVLFAGRVVALYALGGNTMKWTVALSLSAGDWLLWMFVAPAIAWLAARVPVTRVNIATALPVHVATALAVAAVQTAIRSEVTLLVQLQSGRAAYASPPFAIVFLNQLQFNLIMYAVVIGVAQAIRSARDLRERERSAAALEVHAVQLERSLTQTRLDVLRMQLDPHFLFNTMHAISALMHTDVEAADAMLSRLSELLRSSMDTAARHEVSLEEELAFADRYLAIQRARLGDRLRTRMRIHPEALDVTVPSMFLQPLIENAVRHGIANRLEGGSLEIEALPRGESLLVFVRDDGPGVQRDGGVTAGIGLTNTRQRLQHLYGEASSLVIHNGSALGTEVAVTLPLRRASANQNGAPSGIPPAARRGLAR